MFDLFEKIEEWIHDLLVTFITGNLTTMFTDVNDKAGTIATEVAKTPQGWNSNIFNMIHNLSDSVIVPIAGMIITFVLCYELISMITEKNNMHDLDTWMFFKWFFKAWIAVYLVSHTFDITMAIFDVGQHMVESLIDEDYHIKAGDKELFKKDFKQFKKPAQTYKSYQKSNTKNHTR